jgi:hypothetical protein
MTLICSRAQMCFVAIKAQAWLAHSKGLLAGEDVLVYKEWMPVVAISIAGAKILRVLSNQRFATLRVSINPPCRHPL